MIEAGQLGQDHQGLAGLVATGIDDLIEQGGINLILFFLIQGHRRDQAMLQQLVGEIGGGENQVGAEATGVATPDLFAQLGIGLQGRLHHHIRVQPAELLQELEDVAGEVFRCVSVEPVTFLEAHGDLNHHRQLTLQPGAAPQSETGRQGCGQPQQPAQGMLKSPSAAGAQKLES